MKKYWIAFAALAVLLAGCSVLSAPPEIAVPTEVEVAPTDVPVQIAATPTPTIPDSGVGPIIVGAVMAESGVMASLDVPALAAIAVEIERINERGGLLNRPIELMTYDTRSSLDGAEDGAQVMIEAGVDLLVATCDPGFARPAILAANAVGVLSITPCSSDERWLTDQFGELAFSMATSARAEGRAMADWAFASGIVNVAILVDTTSPEAESNCAEFRARWSELGGGTVFVDEFTYDALEPFRDRLAARPTGYDVAVLCSHLPGGLRGAPSIIEVMREVGVTVPLLGASPLDDPTWVRGAVPALGALTVLTPSSIYGNDPRPTVNELMVAIDAGQQVPIARAWSVYGSDLIVGYERAVTRARSVDGQAVARELEGFDGEMLTSGPVTFGPNRHMDPARPLQVVRFADGAAEFIETVAPG